MATTEWKREYMKAYRKANHEKVRKIELAYRERHKVRIAERERAYREAHRVEKLPRRKVFREVNRERLREYGRRPEVIARHRQLEKARLATPEGRQARRDYQNHRRAKNREKLLAYQSEWRRRPGGIASQLLVGASRRAKEYSVPFQITKADVLPAVAAGVCERTGIPFQWYEYRQHRPHPFSPSLDRIDPAKGYVLGNIQVVCWMYNRAKGCGTDADVLRVALALVQRAGPSDGAKP